MSVVTQQLEISRITISFEESLVSKDQTIQVGSTEKIKLWH
jgi:hypothetical protein